MADELAAARASGPIFIPYGGRQVDGGDTNFIVGRFLDTGLPDTSFGGGDGVETYDAS